MASEKDLCAMETDAGGAFVALEDGGDLGEGAFAGVAQGDDLGVGGREGGDGGGYEALEIGAFGELVRQWVGVGRLGGEGVLIGGIGQTDGHGAAAADDVDAAVAGDA